MLKLQYKILLTICCITIASGCLSSIDTDSNNDSVSRITIDRVCFSVTSISRVDRDKFYQYFNNQCETVTLNEPSKIATFLRILDKAVKRDPSYTNRPIDSRAIVTIAYSSGEQEKIFLDRFFFERGGEYYVNNEVVTLYINSFFKNPVVYN